MVSHDPVCAAAADRVVFVADGRIVGEVTRPTPDLVASRLITLLTAVAS
jgi:putative ABC transport system ATP-binding protein